ncbi:MAG: nucleotidyltransferase domain-containing protein [Niameybacter sp.]|uniref:nucleotidyltransferase domain-containing protein n=1 Tax=Niameybacter sp. TaxID=2033640 RepID=UPI002FC8C2A5
MRQMLNIPTMYQERLRAVYDHFKVLELGEYELYLFGSYAKEAVKATSDIDLLILLDKPLTPKEAKMLRMDLRGDYEEQIHYRYEVDVKVYSKTRFLELASKLSFESEIAKYMISLKEAVEGE